MSKTRVCLMALVIAYVLLSINQLHFMIPSSSEMHRNIHLENFLTDSRLRTGNITSMMELADQALRFLQDTAKEERRSGDIHTLVQKFHTPSFQRSLSNVLQIPTQQIQDLVFSRQQQDNTTALVDDAAASLFGNTAPSNADQRRHRHPIQRDKILAINVVRQFLAVAQQQAEKPNTPKQDTPSHDNNNNNNNNNNRHPTNATEDLEVQTDIQYLISLTNELRKQILSKSKSHQPPPSKPPPPSSSSAPPAYKTCALNQPYPRPQHACRTSPETQIAYCNIHNLRIDVSKIKSDRGGEELKTVMGRREEPEFPAYQPGALTVQTQPDIPQDIDKSMFYYIEGVVNNLQVAKDDLPCAETVEMPTLMITRYEYVNLYHTMTDWWNTFLAMPGDRGDQPFQIVFLDAHAKGSLDPVWARAFAPYRFVKHLPLGGVCFRNVTLIPPGYSTHLWARQRPFSVHPKCLHMTEAFSNHFAKRYNVSDVPLQLGKVVIIERIPYVCHPRSNPAKAERLLKNLQDVATAVRKIPGVTSVELVQLETMPFEDQMRMIRSTHILVGNHGAGISHMLFLHDHAHILEFQTMASGFFKEFNQWKPKVTHTLLPNIVGPIVTEGAIQAVVSNVQLILGTKQETNGQGRKTLPTEARKQRKQ